MEWGRIAVLFSRDGPAVTQILPIIPVAIAPLHVGDAPIQPLTPIMVQRTLTAMVASSTTRCQYFVTLQSRIMMTISQQVSTVARVVEEVATLVFRMIS